VPLPRIAPNWHNRAQSAELIVSLCFASGFQSNRFLAQVWDVRARGCQREYESRAPVNCAVLHPNQGELISGGPAPASLQAGHPTATQPYEYDAPCYGTSDMLHMMSSLEPCIHLPAGDAAGNIRVWDLTAGACSCELVPEVGTPVR
jgi:target of rapamycin complex subunit LST8